MKFGFVLSYGTPAQILEMTREAERHGWDGVFTWDGISIGDMESYDPWAMLGAMAMVSERVTLGAMVFPLARRRPWKVAREAITVDHLSNGRLVMPVGLGAADDGGFSRVNTDTADRKIRAQQLDECLAILDLAWSGEPFNFEGEQYQVKDLVFRPKPVQQPRIPIWTVAQWPSVKSMTRATRWDGILPWVAGNTPATPIPAGTLAEIRDWVLARRESDGPYDIVLEGRTSGTDHAKNCDILGPLQDAGATWWIESRWDETDTPESLLERVRQGPPQL